MKGRPQRQVERIFHLLADLTPAERPPMLDEMCGSDLPLRREVEALLAAHDGSNILDEFVEVGGIGAGHTPPQRPDLLQIGDAVGPYRIVRSLGRGGMGSVYLAEQLLPVHRQVALKLIHSGLASEEVLRRFEIERQALALLDSPNIARILDAGATADGRPYFTMEHVDGLPITQYADRERLDIRARLRLFLQVCDGIRHAHQRGIVHRDIKPSNVLVAERDGEAVVKIIDFGVARVVEPGLDVENRTLSGVVLGTPEYMSPEQSDTGGRDVDIRSDVYAAGVLLFELLVGDLPFTREELRSNTDVRRRTTPLPSARLTRLADGGVREARHRRASASHLQRALRGELDWICLRALEMEREDRYQTIDAFADDIERALRHEAVSAGPHSAGYRLRKLARRHVPGLIAASAVLVSLVGAVVLSSYFYFREQRAHASAEQAFDRVYRERQRAESTIDFARNWMSEFASARQSIPEDQRLEMLTRSIELIDMDQGLDERDRAAVRTTIASFCAQQGEFEVAQRLFAQAEEAYESVADNDVYLHADCLLRAAEFYLLYQHEEPAALGRIRRAQQLVANAYPRESFEWAMTTAHAGHLLVQSSDQEAARFTLREFRDAISGVQVLASARDDLARVRVDVLANLIRSLTASGEFLEADDVLVEAKRVASAHALNDDWTRLQLHRSRAQLSAQLPRWEEAVAAYDSVRTIYRNQYGPRNQSTLYYTGCLAAALAHANRHEEAEEVLSGAIAIADEDSSLRQTVLYKLILYRGDLARLRGQFERAGRDYREAKAGFEQVYPQGNPMWFARTEHRLGQVSAADGELDEAESHLMSAHALLSDVWGERAPEVLDIAYDLADLWVRRHEFERAEPLALATHAQREFSLGSESSATIESAQLVERMYREWARPEQLRAWRERKSFPAAGPAPESPPSP